ncbi:MAG: hypothetical protein QXP70_01875 [Methanomassiliicoccales archaeon]
MRAGRNHLPFLLIFILIVSPFLTAIPARGQGYSVTLSISVITMPQKGQSSGMQTLQTAVWNYINLTINPYPGGVISLVAYYGNTPPPNTSVMNYYEWSYSPSNGSWTDPLYHTYIDPSLSSASSNLISFAAGMQSKADTGIWTLRIMAGNTVINQTEFNVVQPSIGLTTSNPTFEITIPPFQNVNVSSSAFNEADILQNTGSLPETITFSFYSLGSFITTTVNNTKLLPGESISGYIVVRAEDWSPQLFYFNGTVQATFSGLIPNQTEEQLIPTVQFPLDGSIVVGRAGYDVAQVSNITVQYRKYADAPAGLDSALVYYISGNGSAVVTFTGNGVNILYVSDGQENTSSKLGMVLSPGSETAVRVEFEPQNGISNATVTMTVSIPGTPVSRSFTTSISISGTAHIRRTGDASPFPIGIPVLFGIGAVIATMVCMIVIMRKHRIHSGRKQGGARNSTSGERKAKPIRPRKGWNR